MKAHLPSKAEAKARAAHEMKELIILTAYLCVAFGAILFFKAAVLQGVGIYMAPWGLAIIKAFLVAKFILMARVTRIGERFQARPLIWPTLYKSAIFLVVVWVLTVIEEAIIALLHGRSIMEALTSIGGGTLMQLVAALVLVFMIFFPYF